MGAITLHNITEVLGAPQPELSQNLTKLFAKLLERNQDPTFVQNYAGAIKHRLCEEVARRNPDNPPGFSTFGKACFEAGIAKTLLAVVTSHLYTPSQPKERFIGQHHALESLSELMQTGNLTERRALLEDMKKNHVIKICLSFLNHPLCVFRQLAIVILQVLASEAVLGATLSAAEAAEIIAAVCRFALEGPEFFIEGMQAPATSWQCQLAMSASRVPADKVRAYVPRYYAVVQETALWTAHGLLFISPMPSQKHCLDILKKKPEIIDILLDCAIIARPPWYPESRVDYIACEVLALLFRWPSHIIPGVSTPQDNIFRAQEWKAMSQAMNILTSREDWCEKIIEVWMKSEEEDWHEVKVQLAQVTADFHALEPPREDDFKALYRYRGISRVIILRLVSTLTHAAESCGITNVEIESLLRMAYIASRKVKSSDTEADAHPKIGNESIMGPTALAHLLVVLAKRNALDNIQGLKKAPHGLSSSTCLHHVQQITNPDVVRRFLKIALQRVRACIDRGRDRVRENNIVIAMDVFISAAELAAALVAFDSHTQGQYSSEVKGTRKELAVALGNAAEMAIRDKRWQQALYFGSAAVSVAENIPANEKLDARVIEKNKRRVEQARAAAAGK